MASSRFLVVSAACLLVITCLVSGANAQVEDQLARYTGDNASGYLGPLADAIGTDLNGGLFHSARIPEMAKYFRLEFQLVSVVFGDDDRTFDATTEGDFAPKQTVEAPTIVGPGEAKLVEGDAGTQTYLPGGFDLSSFSLAVPQLRFGSYKGTEALIRYLAVDLGDVELGDISLFGFGVRHSLSQYLSPEFPVALAGGFFWQSLNIGKNPAGGDLMSSSALSIGVQASKRYGEGAAYLEPYGGLSVDRFSMDVAYESEVGDEPVMIDVDFGTDTTLRLTLGLAVGLPVLTGHAEYCIAGQNSFTLGLGFGN
jgi:hypothetical protein